MNMARSAVVMGASAAVATGCGTSPVDEQPAPETPAAQVETPEEVSYQDGVYDGPRVTNARGGYQAQVTIEGGVITAVAPIEAGTDAPESVSVNAFTVPAIVERVLEAQSADIEMVSGSSFTSPAFTESVEGALEQARG